MTKVSIRTQENRSERLLTTRFFQRAPGGGMVPPLGAEYLSRRRSGLPSGTPPSARCPTPASAWPDVPPKLKDDLPS